MWVYDNEEVLATYVIDLKEDRDVQDNLPCNFLAVRNNSSLIADVYLNSKKVGSIQAYSADSFIGKSFEVVMIKQPDEDTFGIGDLFVQIGKNEQMSSMPYNPSWDMLEENIDVYAGGCDSRLSYSSSTSTDKIKYWVNIQHNKIVQRRLSIQGSASLGSYAITFDPETVLSGGVPINGEVLDTKQYKTNIIQNEFDCTVTNASIKGWMIDFKKKDIPPDYTIVTGGSTVINSYDNDALTSFEADSLLATEKIVLEVSFPSRSLSYFSYWLELKVVAGYTGYLTGYLKINGSWVDVLTYISETSATYIEHTKVNTAGWNLVTGIKITMNTSDAGQVTNAKIYQIAIG